MRAKVYKKIGTAYIVGRVCCTSKKKGTGWSRHNQQKRASHEQTPLLFQVRWIDSQFQTQPEDISISLLRPIGVPAARLRVSRCKSDGNTALTPYLLGGDSVELPTKATASYSL
ncbi:hypothetical protein GQ600_9244 [Phytophthora cactorum]|nr:hypothetical protein GQ600_9244 [Phytophthora cactorum]